MKRIPAVEETAQTLSIEQFRDPKHIHNLVHYVASLQAAFDLYRSVLERLMPTIRPQDRKRWRVELRDPEMLADAIAQTYGEYAERCAKINRAFGQEFMQQQGLPSTEGGLAVLSSRIAADICSSKSGN